MRCPDSTASNAVLGQGAAGAGYGAGPDLQDVAAAAYELRRAAGTLPPAMQATAVDPVEEILATMGEADRMHTTDLVEALGAGWTAARVAEALKPYGVAPGDLKIGGINRNGYRRADIEQLLTPA